VERLGSPRTPTTARRGMVATSEPIAVRAGVDVLRRGGHAVDAAIATNAMLGLVEPMSCGLGGDLFAIVWDADRRELAGVNGSGRAPAAMTRSAFEARGLDRIPLHGPLTWTVPGCVDGWLTLHERFGRLPLADLLEPTIARAETGFPVASVIARSWAKRRELLKEDPGAAATFLVDGRAPVAGQSMRNLDLAASLRAIAEDGRNAFYRGEIAERIVACSWAVGGLIEQGDLAAHGSTWVDPVSVDYRGHTVWELPPNTQGIAALQMLRILEGFDLGALPRRSPELLHLLIEAKKLAFEDRARYVADPAFADVPIGELLSEERAKSHRARIGSDALREVEPADPRSATADTVYLTVVDEGRNAVSLIQSIYHPFGSGVVPPGTGFAMQNRGNLFHLDPGHPNALEPGKRPFHTIIPAFVTREGVPVFSFGVMGGDMQPQGQVQILVNLLDFGMDVQAAGDEPRFRHNGSSTPTGHRMTTGGIVRLEPGFPDEALEGLRARGHRVEVGPPGEGGFGGYQGIWIDEASGTLHGGTESRKDGCALGY
jgi:gamma-glutamyltranspeptidase/glutathione hydrolase